MKRVVRLIVWPATSYSTYEPRTRHASRPRANKSESGWSAINAWRAKPIEGTVVICRTPYRRLAVCLASHVHVSSWKFFPTRRLSCCRSRNALPSRGRSGRPFSCVPRATKMVVRVSSALWTGLSNHRAVHCCRGSTDWRLDPVFWSNMAFIG